MDLTSVATTDLRSTLEPISVPSSSSQSTFTNWAKTFRCSPQRVFVPTTVEQCRSIIELATREGARLHPVGVGHSPSDLACTNGWLLRTEGLSGLIRVDQEKRTATFYAGTTLHAVHTALQQCTTPLAMPNIGSISDQTIGGLISTASHGSGVRYPVLSDHVRSLTLALPLPGAPIVRVSRTDDPDLFKASLCGLGATGLILEVEIEVEEAFRLRETKTPYSVEQALRELDDIKDSAEHVRVWWYPDGPGMVVGRANRVYDVSWSPPFIESPSKRLIAQPPQQTSSLMGYLLGYHLTQFFLYVSRIFPSVTPWVGRWAWWLANEDSVIVDEGHKVLNFDCLVSHLLSGHDLEEKQAQAMQYPQYALEWAVASSDAKACLQELREWLDTERADPHGLRAHFPLEIRWSAADDIFLSPSYARETTWIGIVSYRPYGLAVPYRKFHDTFASIVARHGGRPHWAKEHVMKPKDLEALYPEFDKFREVMCRVDPEGTMRSEYVRRHIDGEDIPRRMFKERS